MKYFIVAVAFLAVSFYGFSQDKIQKHTVQKGETITEIAQKYKVTPATIYQLNPDAQNGIQPDMVLLIQGTNPKKDDKQVNVSSTTAQKTHVVAANETIYGLTKKYSISEDALFASNPFLKKEGLKVGETIVIPSQSNTTQSIVKSNKKSDQKKENIIHQVVAKETKFSIAKQYGITVDALEVANPEIKESLQIGFRLKIIPNQNAISNQSIPTRDDQSMVVKPEIKKPDYKTYEVQPKETMYALTRKFGMTQEDLIRMNPELKVGLKDGMILKYPINIAPKDPIDKAFTDLTKTIATQNKKQLVLLLPFNISKMEGDTVNSTASRLKTDKFLNMTLDFYSGALMAIDSAKTLGLNIDVKIFDSQETKNSSNIVSLIQQNDLNTANAIIGPFYQANIEKTAELLNKSNVPVISPLSKETGKLYSNLLQSMPSSDWIKNSMLEFLRSKNGNIAAIVDPKKLSTKQFLSQNKEVKMVSIAQNGTVSADSIAKKLVKGKINYVILDSEKTGMIISTTNALINLMATYQIQLVILEKNETLDFEEISLNKLAQLHLLYPSLTRDNETAAGLIFEKKFKEKNKIFPNQFATRGFDVTFDTLLRLSQEQSFEATIENVATEGVENKFAYEKKASGAFVNGGFYILYYDNDLSVKEAN
jgi:LysM repeat protein